nr:dual specificity protein phosphatase CDC14B [Leptinotarsa decemlineata]
MLNSATVKRKRRAALQTMEISEKILLIASEFIKGRLFFVSINTPVEPKPTQTVHYFTIDYELEYDGFFFDFGPLNLSMLYHYCAKLSRKLSHPSLQNKKIVHYTYGPDEQQRVNAAFLIGSYSIIYLNYEPEQAFKVLNHDPTEEYLKFRDASVGEPYTLSLLECLQAVKKAWQYGFFNFDSFDFLEYEHYERVENGDFNWILPEKFIAFCGPQDKSTKSSLGFHSHSPENFFAYFRRHNVSTIVRLNKKAYDSNRFVQAGFDHKDLYFVDGGTPSDRILQLFINICENAKGAIAVHCKAGLGRTGSLIACYIMKHYKFTAEEAIAWIRICRPGSIIGHQQRWLQEKQKQMWDEGEVYRKKHGIQEIPKHVTGIYHMSESKRNKRSQDNVTGIVKKVDCMEINDPEEFEQNKITQGDKLNQIKSQRARAKPFGATQADRLRRIHVTATSTTQTVLRGGKILCTAPTRTQTSSSNRVVSKRIELPQPVKRVTTRRLVAPITGIGSEKVQLNEKSSIIKKSPLTRAQNGEALKATAVEETQIKRNKRTLASEKDKTSPRSVKVLRRSHILSLNYKDCDKSDRKLRLPSVTLNKTV